MHLIGRATKHTLQAVLEGLLVAVMAVVLVAGVAFAAKGGSGHSGPKSSGSTIAVVYMDGATEAVFGARVTFSISTSATADPWVHLRCYQNGGMVLEGWQGYFSSALGNEWFKLGPSPAWSDGAASCTADLAKSTKRGWSVLATTTFSVAP